jgi:hypothetical protein
MKRLVLLVIAAALVVPASAGAKGLVGVEACGTNGCVKQRLATPQDDGRLFSGLGGVVQPAAPGPWLRVFLLIGEPNGVARKGIPFFYVPGAGLLVQPGNGSDQPAWWRPSGRLRTIVRALAERVRPFAMPRVSVTVDDRRVADPQSYLRLYTIGTKTTAYPTEDASVILDYQSNPVTPWTTGNYMVVYPKSHLLVRDGQIVAIDDAVTKRIVRGASLASEPSSFPWLPVGAAVLFPAFGAAALLRFRRR